MYSYILIDGSYFVFYRVFALLVWWKNAKPEIELVEPFKNEEFDEFFYLAVPLHKGQLSVREIKNGEVFTNEVKKDEKILIDHIDSPYAKVESLKSLIYKRGI